MGTTAGQATLSASESEFFTDPNGCSELYVCVPTGESAPAQIRVPGLHADDEYLFLGVGQSLVFKSSSTGIKRAFAKSSGTPKLNFGVVSKVARLGLSLGETGEE